MKTNKLESTKLDTVNVIEYINNAPYSIRSYKDNKNGNIAAENYFTYCIVEYYKNTIGEIIPENDFIQACIDDGIFEAFEYQVGLVHST